MLSKSSAKHRMDQTGSIIPIKIYINKLDNCMLKEHFISVTSITRKIEKNLKSKQLNERVCQEGRYRAASAREAKYFESDIKFTRENCYTRENTLN